MNEQPDAGSVAWTSKQSHSDLKGQHWVDEPVSSHRSDSAQVTMPQMLRNFADAVEAGMLRVSVSTNIVADPNTGSQSDAEPVAWRWRYNEPPSGPWVLIDDKFAAERLSTRADIDVEPLYTAPSRPDASGLIEAAEWLMERAHLIGGMSARSYREAASVLRFRAANARGLQTKIEAAEWPFGYQDTFNLISDATGLVGGHIGISVSKFEKAYNKLRARAADRSGKA